jgi:hypothetical protein
MVVPLFATARPVGQRDHRGAPLRLVTQPSAATRHMFGPVPLPVYDVDTDNGSLKFKGMYFGGLIRY